MREKRPEYVDSVCEYCREPFEAHKKSIGYASYCPDCVKNKAWIPSKGKQGKVSNFNKYT